MTPPYLLSHDFAHIKLTSSPPDQTSCFSELQVPTRSALNRSCSEEPSQPGPEELNRSFLETQSLGLVAIPDPASSPGTGAQVTRSKRRVVLARQVTTSSSSSPPDRMIPPKDPEFGTNTESSPEPPTQPDGRPLSLAYMSVGSDEGSTMEVYFSAPENSKEEEEGEVHRRRNICVRRRERFARGAHSGRRQAGERFSTENKHRGD